MTVMPLTRGQRAQAISEARKIAWKRGCTCPETINAAIIKERDEEDAMVRVGVEHLRGCPCWNPRDLTNLPPGTKPDAVGRFEA